MNSSLSGFEKIVVVGLGATGLSCLSFLKRQAAQAGNQSRVVISVVDSRENPPNLLEVKAQYPEVNFYTGGFSREVLREATQIILSPGIPKDHPELKQNIKKGVPILGDIELFAQNVVAPVVAITGSNGKSTVTTLLGEMAKAAAIKVGVGGNLGTPALDLLKEKSDLYILELSSFQLETTYSLKPLVSTILNISPDHMDRYSDLEAYYAAKARIFQNAQAMVVNREDNWILQRLPKAVPYLSFGLNLPKGEREFGVRDQQLVRGEEVLLPISELKLFGRHNVANALAALALGSYANIPLPAMLAALRSFKGLEHRCEWVRTVNEIPWINDSKGTNVGASMAAISGLAGDIPGKWVVIAGGLGKNADFSPLKPLIAAHARAAILIGEASPVLQALLQDVVPCWRVSDLQQAVYRAAELARPGDGVLLSPACASFDMFRHFEERGKIFKELVARL